MALRASIAHFFELSVKKKWLPVLPGILLASLVLLLCYFLEKHEEENLRGTVESEARNIIRMIDVDLTNHIRLSQLLVQKIDTDNSLLRKNIFSNTYDLIPHNRGYQILEWMDRDCHPRWTAAQKGNETAHRLSHVLAKKRNFFQEHCRMHKQPTLSTSYDLTGGEKGVLIYIPLYRKNKLDGYLLAALNIGKCIQHLLEAEVTHSTNKRWHIQVALDGRKIFQEEGWQKKEKFSWSATAQAMVLGYCFTVRCRPTENLFEQENTLLPQVVGTAGIILSLLISINIYLFQKENST
ncbi:MAG: hypothetical protein D3924_18555, partial [Candidatus Electrothrix sp. AR4]|nr:hypothetical protein [Candidatus Electrothrix sp. AR4]